MTPAFNLSLLNAGGWVSLAQDTFSLPLQADTLVKFGYGLDGAQVPFVALQALSRHPVVYLAERASTGIIRRPDLYTVSHSDPKVKAAVEAWLWPLLPRLLRAAARAFIYGAAAVTLAMETKDLQVKVPTKDGTKIRRKMLKGHVHYSRATSVRPDLVQVHVDPVTKDFLGMRYEGREYGHAEAHVWVWDAEFDDTWWVGQGARRRAWRDFCEYLMDTTLENMYLERSVDSPRVAYSPEGKQTLNGQTVTNQEAMRAIGMGLRGAGVASLPGAMDPNGNRLFGLDVLDLPDRSDVWPAAINRRAGNLFMAYLVPPSLGGLDDLGAAAGKTLDGMFRETIEDIGGWAVEGLQALVNRVTGWNELSDVEPATVGLSDVGKAQAKKTLLAVLQLCNQASKGEVSWRTDVPRALEQLGIPVRDAPPAPFDDFDGDGDSDAPGEGLGAAVPEAGANPGGRPRDPNGAREERREDARDVDGEDATGAADESE